MSTSASRVTSSSIPSIDSEALNATKRHLWCVQNPSPTRRINIGNRLGKRPDVAFEILRGVLAFTKWVTLWRTDDLNAGSQCFRVMGIDIFDPYQDGMRRVVPSSHAGTLGHYYRSITKQNLNAMISDAQAFPEPKLVAQPLRRGRNIGVSELGNDRGTRYRSILTHGKEVYWLMTKWIQQRIERFVGMLVIQTLSLENLRDPLFDSGLPGFGLFGRGKMKEVASLPSRC